MLCKSDFIVCQAPLSVGFPRQEYCSELPFPSPGDLPNSGIEPRSPAWQADSLSTELPGKLMQIRSAQEFLCEGFLDLFTFIMEILNTKEVKED